jgi:hypothetical protein
MNISEVSAAEKKAVERDKGKKDNGNTGTAVAAAISAEAEEILAADGTGMGFEAGAGPCGSSELAICGT